MRTLWWLPRIFAGVGVLLLGGLLWRYSAEQSFIKGATRTTGTVIELSLSRDSDGSTWYPIVQFRTATDDVVVIRSNVGSNPPSRRVGDKVDVLYHRDDPQSARIAGFFNLHVGTFVLGILTAVFGGIGWTWLYVVRRAESMAAEVRASGQRIKAKVIEIERRRNIRVNNNSPWRIIAQSEVPGRPNEVAVYRSANIWFDPTEYVGEEVTVYVDRNDPKRHVVDIEFLPKHQA